MSLKQLTFALLCGVAAANNATSGNTTTAAASGNTTASVTTAAASGNSTSGNAAAGEAAAAGAAGAPAYKVQATYTFTVAADKTVEDPSAALCTAIKTALGLSSPVVTLTDAETCAGTWDATAKTVAVVQVAGSATRASAIKTGMTASTFDAALVTALANADVTAIVGSAHKAFDGTTELTDAAIATAANKVTISQTLSIAADFGTKKADELQGDAEFKGGLANGIVGTLGDAGVVTTVDAITWRPWTLTDIAATGRRLAKKSLTTPYTLVVADAAAANAAVAVVENVATFQAALVAKLEADPKVQAIAVITAADVVAEVPTMARADGTVFIKGDTDAIPVSGGDADAATTTSSALRLTVGSFAVFLALFV